MLIDPHDLGTGAVGHLREALPTIALIPTLGGGRADPVGPGQLGLGHATIMGLEDLKAERF